VTTSAESITRAAAVPLLLEVAEAGVTLRCRQYVEVQIDPKLWRDIQTWANAMRVLLHKEVSRA
jgi:hypothetical protein